MRAWEEIHGAGSWNPDQLITAYEFRLTENIKTKENIKKVRSK